MCVCKRLVVGGGRGSYSCYVANVCNKKKAKQLKSHVAVEKDNKTLYIELLEVIIKMSGLGSAKKEFRPGAKFCLSRP